MAGLPAVYECHTTTSSAQVKRSHDAGNSCTGHDGMCRTRHGQV